MNRGRQTSCAHRPPSNSPISYPRRPNIENEETSSACRHRSSRLAFTALPAHAQDTLAAIKAAGKIRVATEFGRSPWGYKDENLKPTGSDYETAALLAKDLGVSLGLVEVIGPNRVPFLISNRADVVISTFSITPERQKVIDFSVPYASAVQYVAGDRRRTLNTCEGCVRF
ncbi:transporter substrate-binding domain-containing protein [Agrobacterium vitis]|uniref:Transporter substrate-binding domain-containing protein n=2 Tax=Agrobacterium vitis TaxID=373 RepID=A0A6L6VK72_AGRVI|nr:transporter substrate-binding domain-containing protein [Agrobacterium vitis]MUZ76114.1 transporter substrate-binding domain-containing protein [Agrobacterium vitis]